MIPRGLSVAVLLSIAFPTPGQELSSLRTPEFGRTVEGLKGALSTPECQELLSREATNLRSSDSTKRAQALRFFRDLGVSAILAEALRDESSWTAIIHQDLGDIFRPRDLLQIYAAISAPWPFDSALGDGGAGNFNTVYRLNRRVEVVLRLIADVDAPSPENPSWFKFDVLELAGFREAWREILETAIKKRTFDKPLDDLIETVRAAE